MKLAPDWWKSKTLWVAVLAIAQAVNLYLGHQIDLPHMWAAIFGSLFGFTIRDTIARKGATQ